MRALGWGTALLLLSGCVGNDSLYTASASDKNIYNISRLSLGMSETEALQVMRQPYSRQTFEIDNESYDVWFYITSPTALGQTRMVPQNLTPLTFKNGYLVGWGFVHYNWLVQQEKIKDAPPAKKKEPETEDKSLENALQGRPPPPEKGKTPPPPTKQQNKPQPKNPPTQPQPKTPPPPTQPNSKPLSMSSRPKEQQPAEPQSPPPESKPKSQDEPKKEKPPFKKEDRDMIEEESEQNFDFW